MVTRVTPKSQLQKVLVMVWLRVLERCTSFMRLVLGFHFTTLSYYSLFRLLLLTTGKHLIALRETHLFTLISRTQLLQHHSLTSNSWQADRLNGWLINSTSNPSSCNQRRKVASLLDAAVENEASFTPIHILLAKLTTTTCRRFLPKISLLSFSPNLSPFASIPTKNSSSTVSLKTAFKIGH